MRQPCDERVGSPKVVCTLDVQRPVLQPSMVALPESRGDTAAPRMAKLRDPIRPDNPGNYEAGRSRSVVVSRPRRVPRRPGRRRCTS
jgi:hypothetical protein